MADLKKVWTARSDLRFALSAPGINVLPGGIVDVQLVSDDILREWITYGWIVETIVDDVPEDLKVVEEVEDPVARGPWRHNPDDLEGKSLDDLNIMVQEIDEDVEPFETVEEAIFFLSQDYQ